MEGASFQALLLRGFSAKAGSTEWWMPLDCWAILGLFLPQIPGMAGTGPECRIEWDSLELRVTLDVRPQQQKTRHEYKVTGVACAQSVTLLWVDV